MLVRASAADFKESIIMLLHGASKAAVNFRVREGYLLLQTNEGVVLECSIPVQCDTSEEIDISVIVESTVSLLDEACGTVEIHVTGDMLCITQMGFNMSAIRVPERSVLIDSSGCSLPFNPGILQGLAARSSYLDDAARVLGEPGSPVDIADGAAYVVNSNVAYIEEVDLPDMRLSAEAVKSLRKILANCRSAFKLDMERGTLTIQQERCSIVATVLSVNHDRVQGMRKLLKSCNTAVGCVDLSGYADTVRVITAAYKKCMVDVSFSEKGIGIFVDSPSVQLNAGEYGDTKCAIRLNTAQLSCMGRLFASSRQVDVVRGGNFICLMDRIQKRILIMSGTVY